MKQEFKMKQGEMDDIIAINKNQMPILKIGNVTTGMDLQKRINTYWEGLSDKYGFKQMTVEGCSKGKLYFLAEPKPIVKPKTQSQIEIDKYLGESMGYRSSYVINALGKIIKQLEKSDFIADDIHPLNKQIAFLALKQLANK